MSPKEVRLVSAEEVAHADKLLTQQLRHVGMYRSKQRSVILRAFLHAPQPISAKDLLYLVKKEDLFISFGAVYRTLKTLVACGLGRDVISPDGTTLYEHKHNQCLHRHLVCKDCGQVIEEQKES
jgi:Fe2+ or Zn2+ uptake regulation protein